LHPDTLTFCQPTHPAALERLRMDENILPTTILPDETEPLLGVVPFNRTDAVSRMVEAADAQDIHAAFIRLTQGADAAIEAP
jgi:hypothetical protein